MAEAGLDCNSSCGNRCLKHHEENLHSGCGCCSGNSGGGGWASPAAVVGRLNDPARFQAHSSGESRITSGGKGVVRIEAEFPAGVDRWCYPKLTFRKPVENFEDAEELRFEIKFDPDPKGFRHVFLMMDGHPNYALPKPDGSWQKVAVNFKEAKIDPAGVSTIQIGANPGGNRLT